MEKFREALLTGSGIKKGLYPGWIRRSLFIKLAISRPNIIAGLRLIFYKLSIMNHKKVLAGNVVVITGASGGVGRATARLFARYKARIALLARGREGLEGARKDVEQLGGEALVLETDVSHPDQVETAAQEVEKKWGKIDLWINNAMTSVFAPFTEMEPLEFKRVTEVVYLGQVYGAMAALKRMRPRNSGSIIFVGSALAYRGIPLQSAYCGAKHAIKGFFESLRCELYHENSRIHVGMTQLPALNTTQFGWVKTSFDKKPRPMGTIYQPEVAAKGILETYLKRKRNVIIGFSTSKTILGNKIIPGWLDKYLGKTGYSGQLTEEAQDENRVHNLWRPVPEDRGAHGQFDQVAREGSVQLWATRHQKSLGIAAAAIAGFIAIKLFT